MVWPWELAVAIDDHISSQTRARNASPPCGGVVARVWPARGFKPEFAGVPMVSFCRSWESITTVMSSITPDCEAVLQLLLMLLTASGGPKSSSTSSPVAADRIYE